MGKTRIGMLCMLFALHAYAAEGIVDIATTDGRAFDSLTPMDIEMLSASDKSAYQIWDAARSVEPSSTYQQSEGPNMMDISSDFSM